MNLSEAQQKVMRDRARRRLTTRLGLLAIFASGLVLAGLMYFETTALAPGRAALVTRFGQLQRVVANAGHVYRVPILDKIVQVDLQPQPMPTIRQPTTGSDGHRAIVELRAAWQVIDAAAYWNSTMAKSEVATRLAEAEIIAVLPDVASRLVLAAAATRATLAQEIVAQTAPALERAGLKLHDVRVTSLQPLR